MPSLGGPEIIVVLLVALIFLGPSRLPEVGRQIGRALHELRKVQNDVRAQIGDALALDTPEAADATHVDAIGPAPSAEDSGPPPPTTSFD
jgi:sec-independent protein translocase protein TatA